MTPRQAVKQIMGSKPPVYRTIGLWVYELTEDYEFLHGQKRYKIRAPFIWYIGTRGVRIPPFVKGLKRAALEHDWYYPVDPAAADRMMIHALAKYGTPRKWRRRIRNVITWYRRRCVDER